MYKRQVVTLVEVDPIQVERILVNLIENALRFSSPAGEVRIEVGVTVQEATVRVVDNGPGISPPDLERVFEPFERVHTDGRHGTGLGLAIARGFAEANGGQVWAESHSQGTSFTLAFPLVRSTVGAAR